ncbi:MAG TPA: hypothetical protein VIK24_07560 [Pyrinomonadaceae bacterium]
MTRKLSLCCSLVLVLSNLAFAAAKPDFNGAWIMDRARSFGLPGNMQQTMSVKQTADQFEVETKLIQPGNERTVNDTYILDGKEYDFAPPVPPTAPADAPKPKGKRTAKWLPNGDGILVTEVTTTETPKGTAQTQVVKKWTFTGEGELTIASFVDGPNGSYEAKRIFSRKSN